MKDIDTSLEVEYSLLDISVTEDAHCTTINNQSFGNVDLLPDGTSFDKYGTMEHNSFILDGETKTFPIIPEPIAFFSSEMSDENGNFIENPTITVDFTEPHSTVALGLQFVDPWPLSCKVTWKTLRDNILQVRDFDITDSKMTLDFAVSDYGKIIIEFTKCLPNHFVKINKLTFGKILDWNSSNIMSGNLTEEINLVCDKISINKLNFTALDEKGLFNLGNKDGYHKYLQKTQPVKIYEIMDNERIFLGEYFVDNFTDKLNSIKFDCISRVGLLDNYRFIKGKLYNGELAGPIIDEIMKSANISDYEVSSEVRKIPIYGAIKPMRCRDALAKILFACQAVLDDSRSDKIKIFLPKKSIGNMLKRDRKISTEVTKKDFISEVTVSYSTYVLSNSKTKILDGIYPAGQNLIEFSNPYTNIITSVGTIIESDYFYCILDLQEEAEVTLEGTGYETNTLTVTAKNKELAANETYRVKEYGDTLVNKDGAIRIANRLLNYFKQRLYITTKYLGRKEKIDEWCIVENPNSLYNNYTAGYESINTDLCAGFIATAKLTGYYDESNTLYYAGNEIYAKDNLII